LNGRWRNISGKPPSFTVISEDPGWFYGKISQVLSGSTTVVVAIVFGYPWPSTLSILVSHARLKQPTALDIKSNQ
jgi:hypothetical protein